MMRKIIPCVFVAFVLLSCSLTSTQNMANTMGTIAADYTQTPGSQAYSVSTMLADLSTSAAATSQATAAAAGQATLSVWPTPATHADGTLTLTDPVQATLTQVLTLSSGDLILQAQNELPNDCANTSLGNFMMQATFTNPEGTSSSWDYAVFFRDQGGDNQLRLVFYEGNWYLSKGTNQYFDSGFAVLNSQPGATNTIQLVVIDKTAYLMLNGQKQAQIDVSSFTTPGDVCVAAWVYQGDSQDVVIHYDDFSVWEFK